MRGGGGRLDPPDPAFDDHRADRIFQVHHDLRIAAEVALVDGVLVAAEVERVVQPQAVDGDGVRSTTPTERHEPVVRRLLDATLDVCPSQQVCGGAIARRQVDLFDLRLHDMSLAVGNDSERQGAGWWRPGETDGCPDVSTSVASEVPHPTPEVVARAVLADRSTLGGMTGLGDLRAEVTARYALLDMPSWPDPHPGRTPPAEAEYSRVSDAARYRITHARARIWADVLTTVPGVMAEQLAPIREGEAGRDEWFDRGIKLSSPVSGTVPLLLLEREVRISDPGPPLAVLQISVVRPSMEMETWPDCGCDACDSGSADLLEAIDESVAKVVGGPLVVLRGPDWYAQWDPTGGSSGGAGHGIDHAQAMDLCRRLARGERVRLPAGVDAVVGRGWISRGEEP